MINPIIICIDDEEIILNSLKKDISDFFGNEYTIETTSSGEEALELITELNDLGREIPIVIADYIMPTMKGDDVLAKIHLILPKTLKIMLTGQANIQGVINAINYAHLYRYISKPWHKEDLNLAIKEASDKFFREKLVERQNAELKALTHSLEKKVTERTLLLQKKTEELSEKNKLLVEANETKVRMFSVVSHDIREPIAALQSVLELIGNHNNMLTQEEIKEASKDLSQHVKKTISFLDNLLQWSKMQMQNIKPSIEWINAFETTQNVIELLESKAIEKGLTIYNHISISEMVMGDVEMFKTILRNLLNNAIKFTSLGGEIHIYSSTDEEFTTFTIQDSGVGISEENIKKLFNVYENFSTTGTLQEKGTGLGLAICKEFVERNGGEIWVKSTEGVGTSFLFTLPNKKIR
jgi:signal transduction histidine kinase